MVAAGPSLVGAVGLGILRKSRLVAGGRWLAAVARLAGMIAVIHQTGTTVMVDGRRTPAHADRCVRPVPTRQGSSPARRRDRPDRRKDDGAVDTAWALDAYFCSARRASAFGGVPFLSCVPY